MEEEWSKGENCEMSRMIDYFSFGYPVSRRKGERAREGEEAGDEGVLLYKGKEEEVCQRKRRRG